MFRLAYIVGQLILGGAEQQLYYLLSGLDRSYFRPFVITLGSAPDEYWTRPIEELGVRVEHVRRLSSRALRVIRIVNILRSENYHLVHSWSFHTNPYAALAGRLAGIPLRIGSMRENYELLTERYVRLLGYRGLDALIANSKSAASQVKQGGLTKASIRFVANGVPIARATTQADQHQLKLELGLSRDHLIIGTIGRLDSNKNQAMLLRAVVPLVKKWPQMRVVIIGEGSLKSRLLSIAQDLGIAAKVSLPGNIPLAVRYLPAMDVCCMTSFTEGMPNLVMEAMAAGVPVISTCCGDTGDLIDHGVNGYLVTVDDVESMSRYLDLLLSNRDHRMEIGRAAEIKMRSEFTVQQMVRRTTEVYRELLIQKRVANECGSFDGCGR